MVSLRSSLVSAVGTSMQKAVASHTVGSSDRGAPYDVSVSSTSEISSLFIGVCSVSSQIVFSSTSSGIVKIEQLGEFIRARDDRAGKLAALPEGVVANTSDATGFSLEFVTVHLKCGSPGAVRV